MGREEKGKGREGNGREERASHTAAALHLAKPRAGSGTETNGQTDERTRAKRQ